MKVLIGSELTETIEYDAMFTTLLTKAQQLYPEASPCSGKPSWDGCLSVVGNKLILWYNSACGSTHVEMLQLN